ncbi:MAG: hypothetical protein OHK93_001209 [Ramalina farinacea]|uniref:Uncharacterized protein n=1 Tax=Ramalina farinacea TaxID=258253 RepID=A0AA43QTE0_9LECA|nr:hypothetical protein [Ramalina farinacea]
MRFIFLIASLLSASEALGKKSECLSGPLPPLRDCIFVLSVLEQTTGLLIPVQWGRTVEDKKPNYVHLPKGYGLDPIPPGSMMRNECEFLVDNRPGAEDLTDTFPKQEIIEAVTDILAYCYPQGKTGIFFPTWLGNVYITVRPRFQPAGSNQTRLALPGHDGWNLTEMDYDPSSINQTSVEANIKSLSDEETVQTT